MKKEAFAYFDTTSWLKLYVSEAGSETARALAKKRRIFSSAILLTETFAVLRRKREMGEIGESVLQKLVETMREDVSNIGIVNLGGELLAKAQEVGLLAPSFPLDAIHIASALFVREKAGIPVTFVTGDRRLLEAAQERGLQTAFT